MKMGHGLRIPGLYWLAILAVILITAPLNMASAPLRANLGNLLFDQFQRWTPRLDAGDLPVRIVDIDDESIKRVGQWPWPRARMATLVDKLTGAQAAAIGLDFLFAEKERAEAGRPDADDGDAAFAAAIAGKPVVLGEYFTSRPTGESPVTKSGFATAGDDPVKFVRQYPGVLPPLPVLAQSAAGVGFLDWLPDNDRIVRRVPLVLGVNGALQASLAMETLRVAQGASTYVIKSSNASGETAFGAEVGVNAIKNGDASIPTGRSGDMRVYFAEPDARRVIPAWKVFEEGADLSDLAGKIVFVGASASLLGDIVATPLSPSEPGVEVHAQILEQILGGRTLTRPDWAPGAELLTTLALTLCLALALPRVSALWCAVLGGVVCIGLTIGSWWAFSRHGLLLDPLIPTISSASTFVAGLLALYGLKRRQEQEIRSAFGRFVSPAVVARLAEHPENLRLGGLQRILTVMFCDLRSFTTLSEGMSAVELTRFLNDYLTPMTDAVLDAQGTVDKYMGDAIMAFWNAPLDDSSHGEHAVEAALAMRRLLVGLNEQWRTNPPVAGKPLGQVKFGVGLNTGECCVGNLGSKRRFDYSAIGDDVNVSSRLEGSSKQFGVDIVASDSTRAQAPDYAWLEIDGVLLKNKTRPVGVHTLAGDRDYARSAEFRELARLHDLMLEAYRDKRFGKAIELARDAARLAPAEIRGLYAYNEKRFAHLAAATLAADWVPVIVLDEK